MDKYIHYGHTKFDINLFCPIKNRTMFSKPFGGFWASKKNALYGWKDWCENENFMECSDSCSITFSLSDNAKILTINSVKDLKELPKAKQPVEVAGSLFENYIDFEKLLDIGYDAVEVNISSDDRLYMVLYGWDCDSILIMNPKIIIEEE